MANNFNNNSQNAKLLTPTSAQQEKNSIFHRPNSGLTEQSKSFIPTNFLSLAPQNHSQQNNYMGSGLKGHEFHQTQ